jgi:uncharacterized membrane protein YdbT with pleckstrin-like domain
MSSYVEGALVKGEKVVHVGKVSLWSLWHFLVFGVLLLPVAVGLVLLVLAYIRFKSIEMAVTTKRVIVKHGFITRNTIEINLNKVESLKVEQSILGRIFDFGTIVVAGTGASHAPISGIANPMAFRKAFVEAQDGIGLDA